MKELKRISIIWGLLLLLIFTTLTFFALKWKMKTKPYFDLEDLIVSKVKSYYEQDHMYPNKDDYVIINYSEIKDKTDIEELKVGDDTCDGYIKVENDGVIKYKGYIKCEHYTSKDYDKYKSSTN